MEKLIQMKVCLYDDGAPPAASDWPFRPVNFLLSLFAHAGVVCALAYLPPGAAQAEKTVHARVYKVIVLKKEPIIYWVRVPAALPSISPKTPIGDSRVFKAEERSRNERIVVQQPDADPSKQLVWQPDKPKRLKTETPLQNMVAVQRKAVPKPFEPPKPRTLDPEAQKPLPSPETLTAEAKTVLPTAISTLPTAKPKPKSFVPPKELPKLALAADVAPDAPPELTTAPAKAAGAGNLAGTGALPKRPAPFVPPPAKNPTGGEGKAITAPPEVSAAGMGSTVTAAVIGFNSAANPAALPDGSRPAAFSRADRVGEPSGGGPGQGPVIHGVAIAGSHRANSSLAPVPASPSGTFPRSYDLRVPPAAATTSAPLRPSSRTLPPAIEARFRERIVYVLVIPKPNLPDYIADWTMWFSERSFESTAASSMRAPLPVRKTLRPDAPPVEGSGTEGWVRLAAVIGKDGRIGSITPLPGRNPAVAAKAAEDLANWVFRPASKNGEPIEVEVVIEVPFHVR